MTSTQILDIKGKKVGEIQLSDNVFGIEPRTGTMHSHLVRQMANARSGSASSLTRSEVRGGGAKPWRQKGTGRARAGSRRSPLWRHGGVIFGPKPRSFTQDMPKKMRRAALKSALSAKLADLVVVKDFLSLTEAKTKEFFAICKELGIENKKLLVVLDYACPSCKIVEMSARNIGSVKVVHQLNLGVVDLLDADVVLTTEQTLSTLNTRLSEPDKVRASKPTARPVDVEQKRAKAAASVNRTTKKRQALEARKAKKQQLIEKAKESGKLLGKKQSASKTATVKTSKAPASSKTEPSAAKAESKKKPKSDKN